MIKCDVCSGDTAEVWEPSLSLCEFHGKLWLVSKTRKTFEETRDEKLLEAWVKRWKKAETGAP